MGDRMGRPKDSVNCAKCKEQIPLKAAVCPYCEFHQIDKKLKRRTVEPGYNKFGVSRTVPDDVKQQVREGCGFGCVVCGRALSQYEHFKPLFSEVRHKHEADGMALLCEYHHPRKTRTILSSDQVAQWKKNPRAKQAGFIRDDELFLNGAPSTIFLGKNGTKGKITNCKIILQVQNTPLIWFEAPTGSPVLFLNALFLYPNGTPLAQIKNNEILIAPADGFDIETPNAEIKILFKNQVLLHLDRTGSDQLTIVEADLQYGCNSFIVNEKHVKIGHKGMTITGNLKMDQCPAGINMMCGCGRKD
jgi:hypothetical protein